MLLDDEENDDSKTATILILKEIPITEVSILNLVTVASTVASKWQL